ncbi:HAD-IIIA family hydrolase [Gammaproteobacteria bacterium]|nr:HAD-IIIA family hydrolase [Gammaproteobacteria bacterium]
MQNNFKDKAIVFDRDGTLIHFEHYLFDFKKVKIFNDTALILNNLKKGGAYLFMHTNQSVVSKGIATIDDVKNCNDELIRQVNLGSNLFEDICIATEADSSANNFRKPSSKFGNKILYDYDIDKKDLYYIGDNICDLETAYNIGCQGIGLNSGICNFSDMSDKPHLLSYPICSSLTEALSLIK